MTNSFQSYKNNVLFLHMPKCGGTSILNGIQSKFPNDIHLDYDSYFKIPAIERSLIIKKIMSAPEDIPDKRIIYGHFFPIKYLGKITSHPHIQLVTILRKPFNRLVSHYYYWCNGNFPDHYLWRKLKKENWSFESFALSREMKDLYSQYFSGLTLNDFDFIGIYEELDFSFKFIMQRILGSSTNLSLDLKQLNTGQIQFNSTRFTNALVEKINRFHEIDNEIYTESVSKFKCIKTKTIF